MEPEKQPVADTLSAVNAGTMLGQITGALPVGKWTPYILAGQTLYQLFAPRFRAWRAKHQSQK